MSDERTTSDPRDQEMSGTIDDCGYHTRQLNPQTNDSTDRNKRIRKLKVSPAVADCHSKRERMSERQRWGERQRNLPAYPLSDSLTRTMARNQTKILIQSPCSTCTRSPRTQINASSCTSNHNYESSLRTRGGGYPSCFWHMVLKIKVSTPGGEG